MSKSSKSSKSPKSPKAPAKTPRIKPRQYRLDDVRVLVRLLSAILIETRNDPHYVATKAMLRRLQIIAGSLRRATKEAEKTLENFQQRGREK